MNAGRYLAGLCVSALGLCASGWLVLTPFAFGYHGRGRIAVTDFATGGGLALVALLTLSCWALAWRRKLRADGVLPARQSRRSRRSARRQARAERLVLATRTPQLAAAPDPAQVLTDLRALLTPLLAAEESALIRTTHVSSAPMAPPPTVNGNVPPAARNGSAEPPDADWYQNVLADVAMAEVAVNEAQVPAVQVPVAQVPAAQVPAVQVPAPAPAPEEQVPSRPVQVQAPGHLRGTRSASFFAPSVTSARPMPPAEPVPAEEQLLRGAELLMVGTGEEEAW
jgi:hypothetical protein